MNSTDLTRDLRSGDDPLHLLAAAALEANEVELDRLRARIELLEWIARLNADTVHRLQIATVEATASTNRKRSGG
jgi:hypothetical protein